MSEFAGALGPMIRSSRHYEGPMGKSDRAVVFGALGLWLGLGGAAPGWLGGVMAPVAGPLGVTIGHRGGGGVRGGGGAGNRGARRKEMAPPASAPPHRAPP